METIIKKKFMEGEITFQQAARALYNAGWNPDKAGDLVAKWETELLAKEQRQ